MTRSPAGPTSPPPDNAAALRVWCVERLRKGVEAQHDDPAHNPVAAAALALAEALNRGDVAIEAIARAAKAGSDEALIERAARLRTLHLGEAADWRGTFKALFEGLAGEGGAADWKRFSAAASTPRYGVVFTGHPTFAMSRDMRAALAACAQANDEKARTAAEAEIAQLAHSPDKDISLASEHADAMKAIANACAARRGLTELILRLADERFGDQARDLAPCPATIASWVGYDLDGRTDISWSDAIALRLSEKAFQLAYYDRLAEAAEQAGADGEAFVALRGLVKEAGASSAEEADAFDRDLSGADAVVAAANRLTRPDERRLISVRGLIALLDEAVAQTQGEAQFRLRVMRAEIKNAGLGAAHLHLRVNAAQVRNAVRADLGVDADVERFGRIAMERAAERAGEARARAVNFAAIHLERMTARRQLMLCAQILKHIDADAPIRFLIAECERPATVLATLYLAKHYGVHEKLDISPLFETPSALEQSGRFMEKLLAEPEYRAYAQERGRASIQIGYSDSGRFMGQAAAALAAERSQVLFARALEDAKLKGVDALVFCTHGESVGRGAHPGGMRERFEHVISPWARSRFARAGAGLIVETSFQGGDGFLHFAGPELSTSMLACGVVLALEELHPRGDDPFYADIAFSWDVYRRLKSWQEHVLDDHDHHDLLETFTPGLLVKTGSRRTKRPRADGPRGARAIRAIPHNATLQQLAFPINVAGGLGDAAQVDFDRFLEALAQSPRWRLTCQLAASGRAGLSLETLRAYASLFDPGLWTARALKGARAGLVDETSADVAALLLESPLTAAFSRLASRVAPDIARLDELLEAAGMHEHEHDERLYALKTLHVLRIALLAHAIWLAARLPDFSPRNDAARADVVDLVLNFDLLAACDIIDVAFPEADPEASALSGIEEPGEAFEAAASGYPDIQRNIAQPLRRIAELVGTIGVGVSHYYDAYG